MKRTTTLLLSFTLAVAALAVPAKRLQVTLTRADGTTVAAYLMGDEHFHYYQAVESGETLFVDDEGYCYVPTAEALAQRRQVGQQRALSARRARTARTSGPLRVEALGNDVTPFDLTGKKKALVMLVDFKDQPMSFKRESFEAQVNEENYKGNGLYGSVHDYFYSQSYGQFDLSFDVVGPLRVSKESTYYGANDIYGDDKYPATMVAEACELAQAEGINFADYDWDGDGEAEMVTCIYAGYGEAQGAPATTIWPHQWTLSESASNGDGPGMLNMDGTIVDSYLVLNELYGTMGHQLDGIGTFCHEYSHSLGLPDIYNTVGGNTFGMDAWNLMDSGCYNGDGYLPCGYTAYERKFCKWLTPTILSEGCNIENMRPLAETPEAYIIFNEANQNEYYLLQNIQQTLWDKEAPGHGMLVIHVDFVPEIWYGNTVNNDREHRCCTIVPADNNTYSSPTGLAGDPYPGTKKNTSLTDTSTPAATLFSRNADQRKFLGKPIENIKETFAKNEKVGTISFTFNGGISVDIAQPTISTPERPSIYDLYGRQLNAQPQRGISISKERKQLN